MSVKRLPPADAYRLVRRGARLVDLRPAEIYARAHPWMAESRPLESLASMGTPLSERAERPVVFVCRTGTVTAAHAALLARCSDGPAYAVNGGFDAWRRQGLPIETPPRSLGAQLRGALASLAQSLRAA